MPNAHRIARECGIVLHGRRTRHPCTDSLPARHTWSRRAIYDAALAGQREDLPEHVYDILGLFLTSDQNATQLYGDAIGGVSKWALRNRVTTEEVTFLRPAFAEIDLKVIRSAVLHHRIDQRAPQIGLLIASEMEPVLEQLRR